MSNKFLALATTKGEIILFNLETEKLEHRIQLAESQITCLDWVENTGIMVGDHSG